MTSHDTASMPPVTGGREKFKQFMKSKRGIGSAILALALIIAAIWGSTLVFDKGTAAADGGDDSTVVLVSQMCENPEAAVRNLLLKQGFKKSEFVVGEDKFDLSLKEATEEGTGNFGASATTAKDLTEFLGTDDPAAKEVLKHSIDAAGVTKEQALDSNNWVGFQMLIKSKWDGNTAYSDGQVQQVGTRNNAKGDLGWVLINPDDCKEVEKASSKDAAKIELRVALVRGGCVNPQFLPPKPDRPDTPPNGGCKHNCNPPEEECPTGTVDSPTGCLKPVGQNDPGGSGGNGSPFKDPVKNHPQGPTGGTSGTPPKDDDPVRTPDDNGQSGAGSPGDGGAGPAEGPSDTTHSGDDTTHTDSPPCPLGPGNCD